VATLVFVPTVFALLHGMGRSRGNALTPAMEVPNARN
jgi:hypothetical protein